MRLCDPNSAFQKRVTSLSLDDGADAEECCENPVEISQRGLLLKSRWYFEIGTQLSVSFVSHGATYANKHFCAEGIVVWCEQVRSGPPALYQTTLLFLSLPTELRKDLQDLSRLLGPGE